MKRKLTFLLVDILIILFTSSVYASTMMYSFTINNMSGVCIGTEFASADVTLQFVGDTDDIEATSSGEFLYELATSVVKIEGLGEYDLSDDWMVWIFAADMPSASINNETAMPGFFTVDIHQSSLSTPVMNTSTYIGGAGLAPFAIEGGILEFQLESASFFEGSYEAKVVPTPGAIWLLGSAFIGLVGFRRKFGKEVS